MNGDAPKPARRRDPPSSRTKAALGTTRSEIAMKIVGLKRWYGRFHVLRAVELTVARGERIVICGPSGGGKSTLLRCINRLETWQKGSVVVGEVTLTDDLKTIDEVRSEVGMV